MKLQLFLMPLLSTAALVATITSSPVALAQDKKAAPTVVLSNAFIGNAWRRSMITAFEEAATKAKKAGQIKSFQVSNAPGENSATEQIKQLKALLLDKPDILLVNPASPTALNRTLQQACDQGVVVVVFDSSTELKCAYIVSNSFTDWARLSTQAVIDGIGGQGNVLIARGVQGSPPDLEMYAMQSKLLKDNPNVKIVGEFFGFCDAAKAQEALKGTISSLPKVDGVIGCGEGLGAAQAFQAAGRPVPVVAFAPSGRALKAWRSGGGAKGSVAVMSDPGQSVAALYTAIRIFEGQTIPRNTTFPPVVVSDAARDKWIAAVGDDDEVASWQWTQALVDVQLKANIAGKADAAPLPSVPVRK